LRTKIETAYRPRVIQISREAPSNTPCPPLPCLPLYLAFRSTLCSGPPCPLNHLATQRATKTNSAEGAPRTEARSAEVRRRGARRRVLHHVPLYLASRSTLCLAPPCPLSHLGIQRTIKNKSAEGAPRTEARTAEVRRRGAKRRVIHHVLLYLASRSTLPPALPCVPLHLAPWFTLPPSVRLKKIAPKAPRAPRFVDEARSAECYTMSRSTLPPALPCLPLYLVSRSTLPPEPPWYPACD
jgi:hypothetical protein